MAHEPIGPAEGEALRRLKTLAAIGACAAHEWYFDAALNIDEVPSNGHVNDGSSEFGFDTCPHPDCALVRAPLSGPVDASGEPELDLAPIKARVAAASKGPWVVAGYDREDGERWVVFNGGRGEDSSILQDQDAEFIADAREVIPALIAEIERLRAAAAVPSSPAQPLMVCGYCGSTIHERGDVLRRVDCNRPKPDEGDTDVGASPC